MATDWMTFALVPIWHLTVAALSSIPGLSLILRRRARTGLVILAAATLPILIVGGMDTVHLWSSLTESPEHPPYGGVGPIVIWLTTAWAAMSLCISAMIWVAARVIQKR